MGRALLAALGTWPGGARRERRDSWRAARKARKGRVGDGRGQERNTTYVRDPPGQDKALSPSIGVGLCG
jgi:hypothetical protein